MKRKIRLSLCVLIAFPISLLAQDWQCLRDGVTTTFIDTTSIPSFYTKHIMWAVNIDSVRVHQGWTYYYGFSMIRPISETNNGINGIEYCFDAYGPSRIGFAMSALGGENFFFNSDGKAIRISTLKSPGQSWICCGINDTTHLYAEVISTQLETILGVSDSVKYITFQAKNTINGDSVGHPMNGQQFVLSKHFGMVTLYDFYDFPAFGSGPAFASPVHILAGIKSMGDEYGELNLRFEDVYKYESGDIFHTTKGGGGPHGSEPLTQSILKVLDSKWNAAHDKITYVFSRYYHYFNNQPDGEHIYVKDTISVSYSSYSTDCNGLDNFPEQTIFCFDSAGTLGSVNYFFQYRGESYNNRRVKNKENNYRAYSFCSDTLVGIFKPYVESSYSSVYYIDGCGGPFYYNSYTDWYHDTYDSFFSLVYFKKGSETWGTPLDTTNWEDPNSIPENKRVRFTLFPNPSNNLVTLEIPGSENPDYRLEIFSLSGIKISEMKVTQSKFAFNISDYRKGMYFLKLYKDNLQLGQEKLIKN